MSCDSDGCPSIGDCPSHSGCVAVMSLWFGDVVGEVLLLLLAIVIYKMGMGRSWLVFMRKIDSLRLFFRAIFTHSSHSFLLRVKANTANFCNRHCLQLHGNIRENRMAISAGAQLSANNPKVLRKTFLHAPNLCMQLLLPFDLKISPLRFDIRHWCVEPGELERDRE